MVVDCYAARWSHQLDLGSYAPTRNRHDELINKLVKWDDKWHAVEHHKSILPAGVTAVLPVVVTASTEWIGTREPSVWLIDRRLPRICTVAELVEFLSHDRHRGHRALLPVVGY